ncbi:hypothetical protein SEVIR_7G120000v4 [Setaria viridis]|uniref:Uncharacterized protein n=1 Tax=Setaria viridis TaxID=4556 RepID=A0A4U6TP63_SETVI|nr:hypothetical protein SEVIR_7G120000v2 [Setaria viridis]
MRIERAGEGREDLFTACNLEWFSDVGGIRSDRHGLDAHKHPESCSSPKARLPSDRLSSSRPTMNAAAPAAARGGIRWQPCSSETRFLFPLFLRVRLHSSF